MRLDFLYNFCLKKLLILIIIQQDIINVYMSSCKVPIIPARFQSKLNLFLISNFILADFQNIQISSFRQTHLMGAELFHMDKYDKANRWCSQFYKCS